MIKHLVLSGGGPTGLTTYGVLKKLNQKGLWNMKNIKTIYGTSVGSLIGIILTLKLEWKYIDNYFIKEEWDKILNFNSTNILELYSEKGLLDESFIINILEPLMKKKNISSDITLSEYYKLTNVDLHLFTVDINHDNMKLIDLSHKTFPNLSILKAVSMSSAIPLIFKPIFHDGGCYLDGGLLNNCPVRNCLCDNGCKDNEILLIEKDIKYNKFSNEIKDGSTILEFIHILLRKIHNEIHDNIDKKLPYHITIDKEIINTDNIFDIYKIIEDQNIRISLINLGEQIAEDFISNLQQAGS